MEPRASDAQIEYYKYLCEQAYVEPDENCADWYRSKMSMVIYELKEIIGDYR